MDNSIHPSTPRQLFTHDGIEYEIDADTGGVLIPLGGKNHPGLSALVDADDVQIVSPHRWSATCPNSRGTRRIVYARTRVRGKTVYMHRLIMGVTDRCITVDHINHDGLDNRRCNMRRVSNQENLFNRRKRADSAGDFKGLNWIGRLGKWQVLITHSGKRHHIGLYETQEEAARAYDAKARELFGEFACLNFPEDAAQ